MTQIFTDNQRLIRKMKFGSKGRKDFEGSLREALESVAETLIPHHATAGGVVRDV